MKWFKMDCDAQDNLDMRKLVDEWGWDWYGRYMAIIGKVGMLVNENNLSFTLSTNNGDPFPVRLLADDLSTTVQRLSDFCQYLADNRLIDPEAWNSKNLIFIPLMRKRADEYTKKLLTKSRQCPVQEEEVEEEEEVEVEKKKKEPQAASRPSSLDEVKTYFKEQGVIDFSGEALKFWAFYDSKGWKVGKTPMVKWRAAAAGWIERGKLKKEGGEMCHHCKQRVPNLKHHIEHFCLEAPKATGESIKAVEDALGMLSKRMGVR